MPEIGPAPESGTRCPNCAQEIDYLNFTMDVVQWGQENGTCDLDGENQDFDESGVEINNRETDGCSHFCPECGEVIGLTDDWGGWTIRTQGLNRQHLEELSGTERSLPTGPFSEPRKTTPVAFFHCPTCHEEREVDVAEANDGVATCLKCLKETKLSHESLKTY